MIQRIYHFIGFLRGGYSIKLAWWLANPDVRERLK